MDRHGKIEYIRKLLAELGDVQLSSKCGKYYALVDNGFAVLAYSFAGKFGYKTSDIKHLPTKTIDAIYQDLRTDFTD